MPRRFIHPLAAFLTVGVWACSGQSAREQDPATRQSVDARGRQDSKSFAALIERLSEPAGYFDTDNLISNERSYLHVMGELERLGVRGGAYIGVGPDQNFSYIAQVRPAIAFIIDIRRDNLLQHLLFKALFALSQNRIEYLSLWLGRPLPDNPAAWGDQPIDALVAHVDGPPADAERNTAIGDAIWNSVSSFGLPLSEGDSATIRRFHRAYVEAGLGLRFHSFNRPPLPDYPTLEQLLLEQDLSGQLTSYLASETSFQYVKSLEDTDLVVPVVGDLGGEHALAAVGSFLTERGLKLSALYTSNVEFYLMRQGSFDRFSENMLRLPRDDRSVIIRSYFNRGFGRVHPQYMPGYRSTQLMQTVSSFADEYSSGGYPTYWDLVTKHSIGLK
jgi:hypothetical protein